MGRVAVEAHSLEIRLRIEDRTGGERIRVDCGQISQLLMNLVHNALAACEEGEGVKEVWLRAVRRREQIVLEVQDSGPGIAKAERAKIFDLFYSTRKGGTGLGLAVVQRIAKNHDADLEVESELGRGTTVRLVLPTADEATQQRGTRPSGKAPSLRAAS